MTPRAPDLTPAGLRRSLAHGALASLLAFAGPVCAQNQDPPLGQAADPAGDKATRALELMETQRALQMSAESKSRFEAEIAAIRADRSNLDLTLIETTKRIQAAESRISATEQRLATLGQTEQALRASLDSRRGVIVEVLAALQRMGRSPPPAVLVRPEDMLEAVRASMLLGAVLPEMRSETDALAVDLAELIRLRVAARTERDTLSKEVAGLVDNRRRVAALVEARQQDLSAAERAARGESERAAELALRAQTLKDLIARLENGFAAADQTQNETRTVEAKARLAAVEGQARETREKIAALALRDPARLAPRVSFGESRGSLPFPVAGQLIKGFNTTDATGSSLKGHAFATRRGAIVSAPCDGWVAYAGPFRSYGQLLIINAGGGYYLLMAGMERISASVGQFVLAGEPVAAMGEASPATSTPVGGDSGQPVLYVELRKDGISIDPAPWWAASTNEKVRG